ncbi:MAG: tetratricopeptide repeat protein [Firmicutes bacterium]|nr:tetratricopeptide repeat protein [Bacillota bacterium]
MEVKEYFDIVDKAYKTEDNAVIESEIKRACELARQNEGESSAVYSAMLSELGGFYRGMTRFDECLDCFTRAAEIMKVAKGADSADYATCINNRASTYRLMGRFDDAQEELEKCLEIYEKSVGKKHILYSAALNNLGMVALNREDTDAAMEYLTESADILKELPGHLFEYGSSLANTAELYRLLGRYEEAEDNLLKAKAVYDTELNDTYTSHYHAILNSLGLVCMATHRYKEAEEWFEKALTACARYFNTEHREYKSTEHNLEVVRNIMKGPDRSDL